MNRFRTALLRAAAPALLLAVALPAFAQNSTSAGGIINLGNYLLQVVTFIDVYLVPLVFALAFIVFIFGIYNTFIAGAANEEKRQEGQKLVLYGLIGFFIMFSVWGLVNVLVGTFGFGGSSRPGLPTFNSAGATTQTSTTNSFGTPSNNGCPAGFTDALDGSGCVSNGTTQTSNSGCPIGYTDALDGSGCVSSSSSAPQTGVSDPNGLH
jgi:hypothetical protein